MHAEVDEAPTRPSLQVRLGRFDHLIGWLVLVYGALAVVALVVTWVADRNFTWWPTTTTLTGKTLIGLAVAGLALSGRLRPAQLALALAAFAFALLNLRVAGVGDTSWPTLATSTDGDIWGSSALGHLVLRWVFDEGGQVDWEPVLAGCLAVVIALGAALRSAGPTGHVHVRLYALAVASTPIMILFARGFVEVTPYAVPLAAAALAVLGAWDPELPDSDVRTGLGVALAVATVWTHGAFVCMAPVIVWAVARRRRPLRAVIVGVLAAAVTSGVILLVIKGLGYHLIAGDSEGGGDGTIYAHDLWKPVRIASALSVAFAAMPVLVGALALLARPDRFRNVRDLPPFAVVAAACHWAFVLLWGFDLGWPADADLMFVTSVLAWPLAFHLIGLVPASRVRTAMVAVSAVIGWAVVGGVVPR